jgi:hypothetical protein
VNNLTNETILSAEEIELRKTKLRANYNFELDPEDDITVDDVFEAEYYESREKDFRPDFYAWKTLGERVKVLFDESGIMLLGLFGGSFIFALFFGSYEMLPPGASRSWNVFLLCAVTFGCLLLIAMPIVGILFGLKFFRYRKELIKYRQDRVRWDHYHQQNSECSEYVKQRVALHQNLFKQKPGD